MAKRPSYEGKPRNHTLDPEIGHSRSKIDILACQDALFEWAESYDTKDWNRLSKCIAPVLRVRLHEFCILTSHL